MSLVKTIAKNINKHRKISIEKFAKKADVSKYTLQKILYGQVKDVQVTTLKKIAKALGVSLDNLVK